MRRGLFTVEDTRPNCDGALMSRAGSPNCAWLNKLKNSARKFNPMFSQGSVNCLMTEKSVFTKSGPESGARDVFPSSPVAGTAKAQGLNQYPLALNLVGIFEAGRLLQVGFAPAPT